MLRFLKKQNQLIKYRNSVFGHIISQFVKYNYVSAMKEAAKKNQRWRARAAGRDRRRRR